MGSNTATISAVCILVVLAVLLTSKFSPGSNKNPSSTKTTTSSSSFLSSNSEKDSSQTTTTSPSSSTSTENNNKDQKEEGNQDNQENKDDDFLIAIPFSSHRERVTKTWNKVIKHIDISESEKIIQQHEQLCRDKSKSIQIINSRHLVLEKGKFDILVFNFESKNNNNKKIWNTAGFHRLFVAIEVSTTSSSSSDNNKKRLCSSGAIFEASLESDNDKIDVDFSIQVRPGLFEFQPFFRRSGLYRFCISLVAINPKYHWKNKQDLMMQELPATTTTTRFSSFFKNTKNYDKNNNNNFNFEPLENQGLLLGEFQAKGLDVAGKPDYCVRQSYSSRSCYTSQIFLKNEKALAKKIAKIRKENGFCNQVERFDLAFRSGAWMKIKDCETENTNENNNNYCAGATPQEAFPSPQTGWFDENSKTKIGEIDSEIDDQVVKNDDGKRWVFVSDTCSIKLYDRRRAWKVVDKQWLLQWGGSTLKQPVANLLEYVLGVSVFQTHMENLPAIRNAKRRPGFFTYRAFDSIRSITLSSSLSSSSSSSPEKEKEKETEQEKFSIRSTYCWGGCPNIAQAPSCAKMMGVNNRNCVSGALSPPSPPPSSSSSYSSSRNNKIHNYPTAIILNHFVWRWPRFNETAFLEQIEDLILWLEETVSDTCVKMTSSSENENNEKNNEKKASMPVSKRPVLIWIGGVRRIFADEESTMCTSDDATLFERRLSWRLENFFEWYRNQYRSSGSLSYSLSKQKQQQQQEQTRKKSSHDVLSCMTTPFRDVVYISRHELTSPLHLGSEYGHFGVHYGATRGMCLTGVSRSDKYSLKRCMRNTTGDWMMLQQWLNILDV